MSVAIMLVISMTVITNMLEGNFYGSQTLEHEEKMLGLGSSQEFNPNDPLQNPSSKSIADIQKAIDELKKVADGDSVFKQAGTVLIKSDKKTLVDELEEKIELAKTRSTVLEKQEVRVKETLKEQEAKITEMMKSGNAPPPPAADDNPRK